MTLTPWRFSIGAILRDGPFVPGKCVRRLGYVPVALALWLAAAMLAEARAADEAPKAAPIFFFDRSLQTIYSRDFLATWFAPRAPLDVVNGRRLERPVTNCADLAALAQGAEITVEPDEREVFERDYDQCFTLSALGYAASARVSQFDHARLGEDVFRHLDLSTTGIEFDGHTREASYTFSDLRFPEAEISNQGIMASDGHRSLRLTFQAAADFSGTGSEELLVAFRLESRDGSSASRVLLLGRGEANGPITARRPLLRPPQLIQFLPP